MVEENEALKSLIIITLEFLFSSNNVYFIKLGSLTLGAYKLAITSLLEMIP
jgi:hypothetical protein